MPNPLPFPKCWWVTDRLLAGPAFFGGSHNNFVENMDALQAAGITDVVSLVSVDEFFPNEDEAEAIAIEVHDRFSNWHGFALPNGSAPDKATMQVILGWVDAGQRPGSKVFLHCLSGRGRTGTVIGCWLARHGFAHGQGAMGRLAELREAAGLSLPCPETDAQRELIVHWERGD